MSKEDDEEKRLCECLRKYQTIVKQIDEIVEIVDVRTRPPPKRRKNAKGGASTSDSASAIQPDNAEMLVQTITRFLHELNPNNPNADSNATTSSRK